MRLLARRRRYTWLVAAPVHLAGRGAGLGDDEAHGGLGVIPLHALLLAAAWRSTQAVTGLGGALTAGSSSPSAATHISFVDLPSCRRRVRPRTLALSIRRLVAAECGHRASPRCCTARERIGLWHSPGVGVASAPARLRNRENAAAKLRKRGCETAKTRLRNRVDLRQRRPGPCSLGRPAVLWRFFARPGWGTPSRPSSSGVVADADSDQLAPHSRRRRLQAGATGMIRVGPPDSRRRRIRAATAAKPGQRMSRPRMIPTA